MAKILLENTLETRKLVEKLTGLEEGEYFEQCYDYAIANLFHIPKFLDVNSHKILRIVDGLRDKFYIHAQSHKAQHFYSLCQDLLKSSVFKENGTADVPFSILCLLFELANRPTEADDIVGPEEVYLEDSEEKLPSANFELNLQLVDSYGRSRSTSPISDLSDWSSDEEVELKVASLHEETVTTAKKDCGNSVSSIPEIRNGGLIGKTGLSGRAWLYQNLEGPLWGQMNCAEGEKIPDRHSVTKMSMFGETSIGSCLFISERQIIREVLWMFEGRKDTRVFVFNDEQNTFLINPKIRTSHLTPEALCALLLPLANIGSIIQMLKQFVGEVTEIDTTLKAASPSQTYKAYASAILQALCHLTNDLAKLNKMFVEQKCTFTLSMVIESLEAWGRKVNVLGTLHINGVKSCHPDWSTATRAVHLLNTLYLTVSELDILGDTICDEMKLVLSIFLKSIRPYMDIIDAWITECNLNDPCQEFIIACNTHVKALDETFWNNSIIIREIPWMKRGSVDMSAVAFLQPVLPMLVLIGKSVEVLRHLGALGQIIKHDSPSLFLTVTKSVTCFSANNLTSDMHILDSDETTDVTDTSSPNCINERMHKRTPCQSMRVLNYLDSADIYDPILTGYFKKEYLKVNKEEEKCAEMVDGDSKPFEINASIFKNNEKTSLRSVLEHGLLSNISKKFEYVCSSLLNLFNNEYQLKESLFALRRYFLMKAGDVMFQFSSQMFDTIPAHCLMYKQAELNLLLEDVLSNFFPKDLANLFVKIDNTVVNKGKKAINAYDSVKFVYQISWPLTIIINSTCKRRYDDVFTFLMQVKYAKYRLDELSFRDLPAVVNLREQQRKTGQMYICRMKLLHFVHGIHHYVLTHVLNDTEAMCEEIYGQDSDLERIISSHEEYMDAICERCFLNPKVTIIMEAVAEILDLALTFYKLWNNFNNIRWEDVHAVEQDLDANCKTIENFVQYISIQESLPYLDSLVTSCCF